MLVGAGGRLMPLFGAGGRLVVAGGGRFGAELFGIRPGIGERPLPASAVCCCRPGVESVAGADAVRPGDVVVLTPINVPVYLCVRFTGTRMTFEYDLRMALTDFHYDRCASTNTEWFLFLTIKIK